MNKPHFILFIIFLLALTVRLYPQYLEKNFLSETDAFGHYNVGKQILNNDIVRRGWEGGYFAFPGFEYINVLFSAILGIQLLSIYMFLPHVLAALIVFPAFLFAKNFFKNELAALVFSLFFSVGATFIERQIRTIPEAVSWFFGFFCLFFFMQKIYSNADPKRSVWFSVLFFIFFITTIEVHSLTGFYLWLTIGSLFIADSLITNSTRHFFIFIISTFFFVFAWATNFFSGPVFSNFRSLFNNYWFVFLGGIALLFLIFLNQFRNIILNAALYIKETIEKKIKFNQNWLFWQIVGFAIFGFFVAQFLFPIWIANSITAPDFRLFLIFIELNLIFFGLGLAGLLQKKEYNALSFTFSLLLSFGIAVIFSLTGRAELLPFTRVAVMLSFPIFLISANFFLVLRNIKYWKILFVFALTFFVLFNIFFGYAWMGRGVPPDAYFTTNEQVKGLQYTIDIGLSRNDLLLDTKFASIYSFLTDKPMSLRGPSFTDRCVLISNYFFVVGPVGEFDYTIWKNPRYDNPFYSKEVQVYCKI